MHKSIQAEKKDFLGFLFLYLHFQTHSAPTNYAEDLFINPIYKKRPVEWMW